MPQFSTQYSGPLRRDHDEYPTEDTLISSFLLLLGYRIENIMSGKTGPIKILDPSAGRDARWGVMTKLYLERCNISCELYALDIQEFPKPDGVDYWQNIDFLRLPNRVTYDIILSNPPYGPYLKYNQERMPLAEAFIRHGFSLLNSHSLMYYLLKLDIETGIRRYDGLWTTHAPTKKVVCSRRPSFYGGKTSGNNYAIFEWEKDFHNKNKGKPRKWETILMKHERGETYEMPDMQADH